MTMIKFNYNDSYGQPSRGSLAFMPHRRHAANETEILPKPFTVPLLNGEATVNLQPNSSSWVWIITEYFENVAKSFYTTIPDRDGIIEHTELVHINPSSIPAAYDAVEPAWWAEIRQYKQTVGETLLKSTEALDEAKQAIETGRESIEQTRNNASLAKAYSEESRQSSYDSKEYRDQAKTWRDEAQEQADRAATGPESAATRAENAATRSETARDRAITAEDESRVHAAEARADATTATTAASTAVTARTEATTQADRAETEANRAQGYADDILAGPSIDADRAEAARDEAETHANTAETHANTAATHASSAQTYLNDTQQLHADTENLKNEALNAVEPLNPGPWQPVELLSDWQSNGPVPPQARQTILGIQLKGRLQASGDSPDPNMFNMPQGLEPSTTRYSPVHVGPSSSQNVVLAEFQKNGLVRLTSMISNITLHSVTLEGVMLAED